MRHAGQHEAILDRGLWEKVQDRLRNSAARGSEPKSNTGPSPLAGKLFDQNNEPLYACGAAKNGRRYRYYVSRKLVRGSAAEGGAGWRLAGPEIERSVATSICFMLKDAAAIAEVRERAALSTQETAAILKAADHVASQSGAANGSALKTLDMVSQVELRTDGMEIRIDLARLLAPESHHRPLILIRFLPLQIKRRGVELRLVMGGEAGRGPRSDPALVKAVARGYQWFNELISGSAASIAAIARREGLPKQYVGRFLPLAFLAPSIVGAIIKGTQPPELNVEALIRTELPLEWPAQRHKLYSN